MFGKLPSLFGRNFVIAYFAPFILFVGGNLFILKKFKLLEVIFGIKQFDLLTGVSIIGLSSWIGGVLLLVANFIIIRFMEGYGSLNPMGLFKFIEKRRYKKLNDAISNINIKFTDLEYRKKEIPLELRDERQKKMKKIVERFPDEDFILPTSFGNTIRAFEVYSRVMYGIDAIPGWARLLSIIPKEYLNLIDDSKANMDFWCNLWLLNIITIMEYVGLIFFTPYTGHLKILWLPFISFGIIILAFHIARKSAIGWGNLVKASFDVFLPQLYEKLGFPTSASTDVQEKLWKKFSQAVIYRIPNAMPIRKVMWNSDRDFDSEKTDMVGKNSKMD